MSHHKSIFRLSGFANLQNKSRHLIQHRTLQMHHLVMRKHKDVVFAVRITHGKGHIINELHFLKYGSSFIYSVKSCIHPHIPFQAEFPIRHLPQRRSPSGHAVDFSAIISAPGFRPSTTEFRCLKNPIASRFLLPPYSLATHSPSFFHSPDTE